MNGLERALWERVQGEDAPSLLIREELGAVSLDGETWVELGRRPTGKKILRCLIDAWPQPVDAWVLHDLVWPGATVHDTSALNRLYAAMHRLREAGLEGVIETSDDGYRLTREPRRKDA